MRSSNYKVSNYGLLYDVLDMDVRNGFFKFGSITVWFLEKLRVRFGSVSVLKNVCLVFFVDQL